LGIVTDTTTEPYERDHAMVSCVYQQKEFEAN
jgi:rRNA 2'-O-methyltransferase fibrillarin